VNVCVLHCTVLRLCVLVSAVVSVSPCGAARELSLSHLREEQRAAAAAAHSLGCVSARCKWRRGAAPTALVRGGGSRVRGDTQTGPGGGLCDSRIFVFYGESNTAVCSRSCAARIAFVRSLSPAGGGGHLGD
jgi:hypothetical protein